MSDKICHLCGTHYNDDPYFAEQPSHTPEKCLAILQYRLRELENQYHEAERQLKRAEKEYAKKEKL